MIRGKCVCETPIKTEISSRPLSLESGGPPPSEYDPITETKDDGFDEISSVSESESTALV